MFKLILLINQGLDWLRHNFFFWWTGVSSRTNKKLSSDSVNIDVFKNVFKENKENKQRTIYKIHRGRVYIRKK